MDNGWANKARGILKKKKQPRKTLLFWVEGEFHLNSANCYSSCEVIMEKLTYVRMWKKTVLMKTLGHLNVWLFHSIVSMKCWCKNRWRKEFCTLTYLYRILYIWQNYSIYSSTVCSLDFTTWEFSHCFLLFWQIENPGNIIIEKVIYIL